MSPFDRALDRFRPLTLRVRLLVSFTAVTILLTAPAVYAATRLTQLREIAFELRGQHAAAFLALGRTQRSLAEFDRFARSYVAVPGPTLLERAREALERADRHVTRLEEAEYGAEAHVARGRLDAHRGWLEHITSLVEVGLLEEATEALAALGPALDGTQEALDAFAATIDGRTMEKVREARAISEAAVTATLILAAICFGLALIVAGWSARTLTAPIGRLRRAMTAVAGGSFAAPAGLPYERRDEVGALSRSFRWMTGRLGELERLRAEYASVVSHDLKTPVNVIGGYAQLLEDGIYTPLAPDQREPVSAIREQADVLAALADQLLEMSRFEADGLRKVETRETSSRELFSSIERAFSVLAAERGVAFGVQVHPTTPEWVTLDPERMRAQVLSNLISNALKFTPPGGSVTVGARQRQGSLHIDVSDTGVGIPEEDLPHVFEKFFRVQTEGGPRGTGLGLAIAREVVEAHGGTIMVSSAPGAGTTVRVVLPQPRRRGARARGGRRAAS